MPFQEQELERRTEELAARTDELRMAEEDHLGGVALLMDDNEALQEDIAGACGQGVEWLHINLCAMESPFAPGSALCLRRRRSLQRREQAYEQRAAQLHQGQQDYTEAKEARGGLLSSLILSKCGWMGSCLSHLSVE